MTLALHARDEGGKDAPALILAHPLGANLNVWDRVAPTLAQRFRVIRFDFRGHGQSPKPPGPYTLAQLAGDVVALMDRLDVARAHFLGLSMGGAIGQFLAIHAPNRLEKLVLANTAPYFPDAAGWNGRIRSARENGMRLLAPAVAERWLTPGFRASCPEVAASIVTMLLQADPVGYAGCCAALRDTDLRDALQSARKRPTLVMVGDSDPSTPPALGEILAGISGGALLRLKAAHLSVVEAQTPFLQAALDFLG